MQEPGQELMAAIRFLNVEGSWHVCSGHVLLTSYSPFYVPVNVRACAVSTYKSAECSLGLCLCLFFIYYIVYVNILTRLYYMYRIPCLQPTTLPRVRPCGSTPTHPSLIQNKLDPKLLHNGSQALSSVAEGCEAAHGRRRQRQKGRSHTSTSRFKGSCKQGS